MKPLASIRELTKHTNIYDSYQLLYLQILKEEQGKCGEPYYYQRSQSESTQVSKKISDHGLAFSSFVFNFLNMEITDSPTLFKYEMTNHPY